MARKPNVNLTDTFETWRQKTNQISSNVGDPDALTTPVTSDLVNALNEVNSRTTQSFIRSSISLVANNSTRSTLTYNPTTGVITYTSNTLVDSDIPDLDASRVPTGIFNANQIPGLDACMIITGTLDSGRLPVGAFEFHRNGLDSKTTDDLQEGSSNLYYTDQRVYAAVGTYPGDNTLDYNTATGQFRVNMTTVTNDILNSVLNSVPAPGIDAATAESITLGLIDSAYINARITAESGGPVGIQLTNLSVVQESANGGGALAYNNSTGVFTFNPADLSTSSGSTGSTKVYRQEVQIPALDQQQTLYEWASTNFPTGITRKPDKLTAKATCTAASLGYNVGDVVYLPLNYEEEQGKDQGYNIFWNSNNQSLNIVFGQNAPFFLIHKNSRKSELVRFNREALNWDMVIGLWWYGTDADEDIDTTGTFTQI